MSLSFFIRPAVLSDQGPTLMTSLILVSSTNTVSTNIVMLGGMASTCDFGEGCGQSTAGGHCKQGNLEPSPLWSPHPHREGKVEQGHGE